MLKPAFLGLWVYKRNLAQEKKIDRFQNDKIR